MPKNPKSIEVLSRGIAFRSGQILLCRNKKSDYWYLPGGHVEPGETAATALCREFKEETGKAVRVGPLVMVHEHFFRQKQKPRHEYSFVFEVDAPFAIKAREAHLEFRWMDWGTVASAVVQPKSLFEMVGVFLEEHALDRSLVFKSTKK